MHPSPHHDALMSLVTATEAELAAAGVDGAIIHLSALAPEGQGLTWFPLEGSHPLDLLLGFLAPPHWRALGVSCQGDAHLLGAGQPAAPAPRTQPHRATVTVLLDRSGGSAGLLRRGPAATTLPGPPQGEIADACRRALGLATAPPPATTLDLLTLTWLDRVVDLAGRAETASRLRTWAAVARLHPAAAAEGHRAAATVSPVALAASAATLADAWPWARLRAHPSALALPGRLPSAAEAAWMDDGMWARWLLSRLPAADDLVAAVDGLLPPAIAEGVVVVVRASRGRW
jgi:hypothetical protein